MSTHAQRLQQLEDERKLFRFAPELRRGLKRRLYLTVEAHKSFSNPSSAANFLPRPAGRVEAAMVRWVSGGLVFTDDRGKPRFLKELEPPPCADVWEVRVQEPDPEVRLIGGFLERDTLILSCFRLRGFLGKKGSQNWLDAMNMVASDFNELFGNPPLHANQLSDYISENFDDFPLKR